MVEEWILEEVQLVALAAMSLRLGVQFDGGSPTRWGQSDSIDSRPLTPDDDSRDDEMGRQRHPQCCILIAADGRNETCIWLDWDVSFLQLLSAALFVSATACCLCLLTTAACPLHTAASHVTSDALVEC